MACLIARPLTLGAAAALSLAMTGPAAGAMEHDASASSRSPALMTRAAALSDQKRWVDALAIYQRLQSETPDDPVVYRLRVMTLADLGSASLAWSLYQARPELFSEAERARLSADRIARLTVWGGFTPLSEGTRLADMQRAADARALGAGQVQSDPGALLRQRFDDIVVLNGLDRHEDAALLYQQLRAAGTEVPPYAQAAAGDSLLAIRRPEDAIHALEGAAAALPDDIDTQVVLAYAYLESERHADALAHLQKIAAREPAWPKVPGAPVGYQNWNRYQADTNLAMIHAYSSDPVTAQAALAPMARLAPNNADLQAKLGTVFMQRGWEDQALERFNVAHTIDPLSLQARIGQVGALAQVGRIDQARSIHDALLVAFPGNVHVDRMHQDWRTRTGWQVEIGAQRGRSEGPDSLATASPLGSDDGSHAISVYSPLLGDRWRVGAFQQDRWAEFQGPRVRDRRHGVGVRYAYDRLSVDARVSRSDDAFIDATSVGIDAGWRFSETLQGRVSAERDSADASLQARASGIGADTIALGLDWTPDERSALSGEIRQWRYDDGNRREGFNINGRRLLRVQPRSIFAVEGGLHASRGDRDDAPYFNPGRDAGWNVAAVMDSTHWRRYESSFSQRIGVGVGQYWQEDFGSAVIPSLQYRHDWQLGSNRHLDYGLGWSRPVYDGTRETRLTFDIAFRWGN